MTEKIAVGNIVEGKVLRIKPFGAIVLLEDGVPGLVHISQIANSFVQNINDHLTVGETVKVKILSIDKETNRIFLSIREALPPEPKQNRSYQNKNYDKNQDNRGSRQKDSSNQSQQPSSPEADFEDKLKAWLKQANENQAGLNKRINKR